MNICPYSGGLLAGGSLKPGGVWEAVWVSKFPLFFNKPFTQIHRTVEEDHLHSW